MSVRIAPTSVLSVEGVAARDRVSRGQQKMLAAAFILAQLQCHTALGALRPP